MNAIRLLTLCLLLCGATFLNAQEFSGGFRAGLNFSALSGPTESDGTMDLETFNKTTGFHIGATFAYEITDLVGLKADLMYTQKGGEIEFNGPSYFYLYADRNDADGERFTGDLRSERDNVNSYIDIPVVAYYRLGPLEFEGGVSAGFLVNSRASGSAIYTDNFIGEVQLPDDVSFNYDFNYFNEVVGRGAIIEVSETPLSTGIFPPSVIDAYYNSDNTEPRYKRLDFGLVGGVSVFLNNGLYLGMRYQYGLTDATRGENDQRLYAAPGVNEREYNNDNKDYNRVIQASIGFRF